MNSSNDVLPRQIFCCWTGVNPMSVNRLNALISIVSHTHMPVAFLNAESYRQWELPNHRFHPGFEYLSATHKADYLRCYLMHHHGGGYTDLKLTYKAWPAIFDRLQASSAMGAGYTEVSPGGVAPVPGAMGQTLRENYQQLIGLCAFVFKKNTQFTAEWLGQTNDLLSTKFNELKDNPARHPQDILGFTLSPDEISRYPFGWTELLGNIFHPLVFHYRDQFLHEDLAPIFRGYR